MPNKPPCFCLFSTLISNVTVLAPQLKDISSIPAAVSSVVETSISISFTSPTPRPVTESSDKSQLQPSTSNCNDKSESSGELPILDIVKVCVALWPRSIPSKELDSES